MLHKCTLQFKQKFKFKVISCLYFMFVRKLVSKGRIRMKRILGQYTMQLYGIVSWLFFCVFQYDGFTIICRLHRLWIEFERYQYYTIECGIINILLLNQCMIIESCDFLVPWQTASVPYVDTAWQKFHRTLALKFIYDIFTVLECYAALLLVTDISGQPVAPIFKGQTVFDPWKWVQ